MKIYTKTGDEGHTGLFGGARVSKADARVQTYGDVDELNSTLGAVRARGAVSVIDALLLSLQGELFVLGAELARAPGKDVDVGVALLTESDVERLERAIDEFERELPPLKTFILPGGSECASLLHVARSVCRRAERRLVALANHEAVRPELLRYINRLSDLLFVTARYANFRANVTDVPWLGRKAREGTDDPEG
jgi:cob(I)alamin adenosyltransferase